MKKALKWLGILIGALLGLIILALIVVYVRSGIRINKQYDIQPAAVSIPTEGAIIAEGERLYIVRGCADCHERHLSGGIVIDDPALGRIV